MHSHRFPACALAVACAAVLATCGGDSGALGPAAIGPRSVGIFPAAHHSRLYEYPVEGVDLGQGWHREGVSKAIATCIEFTAREDTGQEQSMDLSVISDSSALMDKLDLSAEAKFKSISFSVSGKARFAKETELKTSSVNVLAHARVMNGVEYVAPADAGSQQGRIDLTPHYRDLARRDHVAFEQECGDGFVAAIHSGAELTALLSFTTSNSKDRKDIEASMSGSGWGFSAKGSVSSAIETAATKSSSSVTFYQTGGSGSPIPTTQDGFMSAINLLPQVAARDPYNYQIQVLDYSALSGYPRRKPDEEDEFLEKVATSYGRLETLRVAVVEALQASKAAGVFSKPSSPHTGPYVDAHADQSPGAFRRRMHALHDDLLDRLRALRQFAQRCTFYDEDMNPGGGANPCALPSNLDLRNDYAYRLRLPVLRDSVTAPSAAADVMAAVVDQHVRDISRRRCELDLEDPGCLAERAVEELSRGKEGVIND